MISSIVSRLVILVFGTLYPAYASYKAVRSRDVREYVKWMMYWIVFALFTCGETITDVFLSFWFPFYYEIKIGFVLWLLSPATKGSSILYRKFVHPMLTNREQEIDEYIARAKEQGYHTVLHLGSKGVNYATNVIMQTAIKSVEVAYKGGGGLVNQLRKSYSLSDLTEGEGEPVGDVNRNGKDVDGLEYRGNRRSDRVDGSRASNRARGYSPRRSASGSARMEMYFPEVDLEVRQRRGSSRSREPSVPLSHIRSSEDVSYGNHYYEDASEMETDQNTEEPGSLPAAEGPLVRTASVGSTRTTRTKGAVSRTSATSTATTTTKKASQGEDVEVSSSEEEDFWSDPSDFSPMPDRTIFANDPSKFPVQNSLVEIESIVCSTDVVDLGIIMGSSVSDPSDPICLVEKKLAESDNVNESFTIKGHNLSNDISPLLIPCKLNISKVDEITVGGISPVTSNGKSCNDQKTHVNPPSDPSLNDINLNTSSGNQVDSKEIENNHESPVLEVPCEQPVVNESSTTQNPSFLSSSVCEKIDKEAIEEVSRPSTHISGSDCTTSKNDQETIEPSTCLEDTKPNETTVNHSSELVDSSKSLQESDKGTSEVESQNSEFNENLSKITSTVLKEELSVDPRGGRYHKPPAPKPPEQNISSEASPESEKPEETGEGKSVRARLVLKPGIVRSLPDVNVASSSDSPVKSEVFMAVNSAPWSRLSSSPSPQASPKPSRKGKLLARSLSKGKADKGPESSGFPRFLNMTGRPHLGSLTSIFPFWHSGSSSAASSGSKSDQREEKKNLEENKSDDGNRGVKSESQFPVHKLSHSPTRYGANRKI